MRTELTSEEMKSMENGFGLSTDRMREIARTITELSNTVEVNEAVIKANGEDLKTAVFIMERLVQSLDPQTVEQAYIFLKEHPFPDSYEAQAREQKALEAAHAEKKVP